MAERRMFAKTIVLSDAFLDMPLSARCLYFTLGMFADDDGFVNSPKGIMRQCGASEDDLKLLLTKKFVLAFESGVIVIKHWRINNYLRGDRYHETKHIDEKNQLEIDENGAYKSTNDTLGIPSIGKPRLDKVSIDKVSIDKNNIPPLSPYEGETSTKEKNPKVDYVQMIKDRNFDIQLEEVVIDWLNYKTEKRQAYKLTGFKSLLTEIQNNVVTYGVDNVIEVVRESMSNNWQGISWNRLKRMKPLPKPQPTETKIEIPITEYKPQIERIPKELADRLRARDCVDDDGSIWYGMLTEEELAEVRKYGLCV